MVILLNPRCAHSRISCRKELAKLCSSRAGPEQWLQVLGLVTTLRALLGGLLQPPLGRAFWNLSWGTWLIITDYSSGMLPECIVSNTVSVLIKSHFGKILRWREVQTFYRHIDKRSVDIEVRNCWFPSKQFQLLLVIYGREGSSVPLSSCRKWKITFLSISLWWFVKGQC